MNTMAMYRNALPANIKRQVATAGEWANPRAAARGSPTTGAHTSSPHQAP